MTDDDIARDLKICAAATARPWDWFGNTKMHEIYLATVNRGRVLVMDFDRWGMSGGQPRFQINHIMWRIGDLGKAEHPQGPLFEAPHRRQFRGIGHPDAQLIVAACNGYEAALGEVATLRAALAAMTVARDELGAIARHMYAVADGNGDDEPGLKERIAALRAVGGEEQGT